VFRNGNVLELPASTIQIVEACSGLRSVVSLASMGVLLAWATPGPALHRAMLVISALPVAVAANGLRVAGSGAASEVWGPAMLKDPWHSIAGWLTFLASLGVLWAIRRALLGAKRAEEPACAQAAAA
jgi:exosortase